MNAVELRKKWEQRAYKRSGSQQLISLLNDVDALQVLQDPTARRPQGREQQR